MTRYLANAASRDRRAASRAGDVSMVSNLAVLALARKAASTRAGHLNVRALGGLSR